MVDRNTFKQGRYEVIDVLNRGMFSTVYTVYDEEADKRHALKALDLNGHDKDIATAMFTKEVDALTGFHHEAVIRLVDYFTEKKSNLLCVVLELVNQAKTLAEIIENYSQNSSGHFSLPWRLETLQTLIDVIDQAHSRHVIHRDIKLNNVLVGKKGGQYFVKLADFGIAKVLEHYGKNKGLTLKQFHTVPYASPEQLLHNQATNASDYYSFGVLCAALLTWQIPTENLEGEYLSTFLEPLNRIFPSNKDVDAISSLIKDLLHNNPLERPRPPQIKRVLQSVLNHISTKPLVGLKITRTVWDKLEEFGMSPLQFFEDLNDFCVAEYQENNGEGEKRVNVLFYGRTVSLLAVADRSNSEQLVAVNVRFDQPRFHQRNKEGNSVHVCNYKIVEGEQSAYDFLNEFYEYHRRDQAKLQRFEAKENLLEASLFILDKLESQAIDISLYYRQIEKQQYDDILNVEILNATTTSAYGIQPIETDDSDVIGEWIDGLDDTAVFSLVKERNKTFILGSLRFYDRYTRELSIKTSRSVYLPPQGYINCLNIAQLASNNRQRIAVDRFLGDDCVNPRLGELLLRPRLNTLGTQIPRSLIQQLTPKHELSSIVERALAAQDFFLIQGPPGTGKTTIISEIILQILKENPNQRILLTAQANPAVDNALDSLRSLVEAEEIEIRTLKLTRNKDSREEDEFEGSFNDWVDRTRQLSRFGVDELKVNMNDKTSRELEDVISNWREKLTWADDVRYDYAQSVQVYGVTCLRAPTLWELLKEVKFDWVIIDEAAKATDTEVLVPLVNGKRFILVGDQRQLPPYINNEIEREMKERDIEDGKVSLFEKLFRDIPRDNKVTLNRQFRMHSSIGKFVGDLFYHDIGGLKSGVDNAERDIVIDDLKKLDSRVLWFDVNQGKEEREEGGTSFFNQIEAAKIDAILSFFNEELKKKNIKYSVGVITPYKAQVDVLNQTLAPNASIWTNLSIEVSTVDAFQGRENDITVYSLVRTERDGLRFAADERRLNVTFSRAKRALLIFGSRAAGEFNAHFRRALQLIPEQNVITESGSK